MVSNPSSGIKKNDLVESQGGAKGSSPSPSQTLTPVLTYIVCYQKRGKN